MKRYFVADAACGVAGEFHNRQAAFDFATIHQHEHDSLKRPSPVTVEITDRRAKEFTNDKWIVTYENTGSAHVVPGWSQDLLKRGDLR